jgi:DNA polymerase elongation subunit (family B)
MTSSSSFPLYIFDWKTVVKEVTGHNDQKFHRSHVTCFAANRNGVIYHVIFDNFQYSVLVGFRDVKTRKLVDATPSCAEMIIKIVDEKNTPTDVPSKPKAIPKSTSSKKEKTVLEKLINRHVSKDIEMEDEPMLKGNKKGKLTEYAFFLKGLNGRASWNLVERTSFESATDKVKFVKLNLSSFSQVGSFTRFFQNSTISVDGKKLECVVNMNPKPYSELAARLDIPVVGWVDFKNVGKPERKTKAVDQSNYKDQGSKLLAAREPGCYYEFTVPADRRRVMRNKVLTDLPMFRCLSFDLEVFSDTKSFPDAKNMKDVIFQISMILSYGRRGICNHLIAKRSVDSSVYHKFTLIEDLSVKVVGSFDEVENSIMKKACDDISMYDNLGNLIETVSTTQFLEKSLESVAFLTFFSKPIKYLLSIGEKLPDPLQSDYNLLRFTNEASLIQGFISLFKTFNPHIIIGYNMHGFDLKYLYQRATQWHNLGLKITKIGIMDDDCNFNTFQVMAKNKHKEVCSVSNSGRLFIDLLTVFEDEKLEDHKLDTVAKHFLSEEKDDFHFTQIFEAYEKFQKQDPEGIQQMMKCGQYCVQDSNLVTKLFYQQNVLPQIIALSSVCNASVQDIHSRGQLARFHAKYFNHCYHNNIFYAIRDHAIEQNYDYAGAMVFPPVVDVVSKAVSLDFASLYPSIMIAYNICVSTLKTSWNPNCISIVMETHENDCKCVDKNGKPKKSNVVVFDQGNNPKEIEKDAGEVVLFERDMKPHELSQMKRDMERMRAKNTPPEEKNKFKEDLRGMPRKPAIDLQMWKIEKAENVRRIVAFFQDALQTTSPLREFITTCSSFDEAQFNEMMATSLRGFITTCSCFDEAKYNEMITRLKKNPLVWETETCARLHFRKPFARSAVAVKHEMECLALAIGHEKKLQNQLSARLLSNVAYATRVIHDTWTLSEWKEGVINVLQETIKYVELPCVIVRNPGFHEMMAKSFFSNHKKSMKTLTSNLILAPDPKGQISRQCQTETYYFDQSVVSVSHAIIKSLLEARAHAKQEKKEMEKDPVNNRNRIEHLDTMQLAFKTTSNSIYGASGARGNVTADVRVAKSVTAIGRYSNQHAAHQLSEIFRGEILYGDTDSNYVKFKMIPLVNDDTAISDELFANAKPVEEAEDAEIFQWAKFVAREISKTFKAPMKLEFEEKIYDQILFVSKKRYAYTFVDSLNQLKVGSKGLISARRGLPKIIPIWFTELLEKILIESDHKEDGYQSGMAGRWPEKDAKFIQITNWLFEEMSSIFQRRPHKEILPLSKNQDWRLKWEMFEMTKKVKQIGDISKWERIPNEKMLRVGEYKIRDHALGLENVSSEEQQSHILMNVSAHVAVDLKNRARGKRNESGARISFVYLDKGTFEVRSSGAAYVPAKTNYAAEDLEYFIGELDSNSKFPLNLKIDYVKILELATASIEQILIIYFYNRYQISPFTLCATQQFLRSHAAYRVVRMQMQYSLFKPDLLIKDAEVEVKPESM